MNGTYSSGIFHEVPVPGMFFSPTTRAGLIHASPSTPTLHRAATEPTNSPVSPPMIDENSTLHYAAATYGMAVAAATSTTKLSRGLIWLRGTTTRNAKNGITSAAAARSRTAKWPRRAG